MSSAETITTPTTTTTTPISVGTPPIQQRPGTGFVDANPPRISANSTTTMMALQLPGPMYAGGMVYHPKDHTILFTGSSFAQNENGTALSQCFFGRILLDKVLDKAMAASVPPLVIMPVGTANSVPEACSALTTTTITTTTMDDNNSDNSLDSYAYAYAYLVGTTEVGGWMATDANVKQYGTVTQLHLEPQPAVSDGDFAGAVPEQPQHVGGYVIGGDKASYPVAVVSDHDNSSSTSSASTSSSSSSSNTQEERHVYVASLGSREGFETTSARKVNGAELSPKYPDLTMGGRNHPYGFHYYLRLTKLLVLDAQEDDGKLQRQTLVSVWDTSFATKDTTSVYTTGMIYLSAANMLIVVGSTRGSGGIYGEGGSDLDGFVVKLDAKLGQLFPIGDSNERASTRINSPNDKDDWIYQICDSPEGGEVEHFYIVGATMGYDGSLENHQNAAQESIHPLILKMDVATLTPIWWKQLEAVVDDGSASDAFALACAVDPENRDTLYVVGVVKDGATMVSTPKNVSQGKDDIFVAQLSASTGSIQWVRQLGTSGNERLANGGGIAVDKNGDAIILAQTEGSLFRDRSSSSGRKLASAEGAETILFTMSKDGLFQTPVVVGPQRPATNDGATDDEPEFSGIPVAETNDGTLWEEKKPLWITLLSIFGTLFFCCCCCISCLRARKRNQDATSQRKMVGIFEYLHFFDVGDIDIRRSPAGGYHATYLNDLSHGENLEPPPGTEIDAIV